VKDWGGRWSPVLARQVALVSAGSYRSQAAMAWPISAPESSWMKWMPGTVTSA